MVLQIAVSEVVRADVHRVSGCYRYSVRIENEWHHKTVYEFRDGGKVELNFPYYDVRIFPASQGFELLSMNNPTLAGLPEEPEKQVDRQTILAWETNYEDEDSFQPIFKALTDISWPGRYFTFKAFRLPDGRVQWCEPFDSATFKVLQEEFGEYYRFTDGPTYLANEEAWIDMVSRVCAEQDEEERRKARCPNCGSKSGYSRKERDDVPFYSVGTRASHSPQPISDAVAAYCCMSTLRNSSAQ